MKSELQSWLDIATHALAPAPAQRVRAEYLAAFEDAQAVGETDILAGWGDPRRVNRELRKVHLTVTEVKVLDALAPSRWGAAMNRLFTRITWWSAPLLIVIYASLAHSALEVSWFQAVVGNAVFWFLYAAATRWSERQVAGGDMSGEAGVAQLCLNAGTLAWMLGVMALLPWREPLQRGEMLFSILTLCLLMAVWSGMLWRKVRRAQQVA